MKKNLLFITLALVTALVISLSSCSQAPATKVELKTEADTISYSFGASISENLEGSLLQTGIIVDTMNVSAQYAMQIGMEQDDAKKVTLQKEMRHKIDSIQKANDYAMTNFLKGFKDGLNARESENSYNLGLSFGNQIAQQAVPSVEAQFLEGSSQKVNKNALLAAVSAAVQKKQFLIPNASAYMMMKSQEKQQQEMEKRSQQGEANREEGEKFLAENKTKPGIVVLESGVQYKILKEGNGPKPKAEDRVVCHYHGTLIDGTVFDSSVERGETATFPVERVIPGWTEILQLMPVGSKWELYIPYDMAYGEQGTDGDIGPFTTLKFQIELLDIAK